MEQTETKAAFAELARRNLGALYASARRLTHDGAEDLVQEALLRAFRAYGSLRDEEAGSGWLKAILVNVWRDRLRKQARSVEEVGVDDVDEFSLYRTVADEDPFPFSDTLHADFLGVFGREDVRAVLLRLPDLYRAPLVLRYVDGFDTKQIARMLGAPLGTVLSRLHRGRKRFERELWTYAREAGLCEKETVR